jgi:hypothetical protein
MCREKYYGIWLRMEGWEGVGWSSGLGNRSFVGGLTRPDCGHQSLGKMMVLHVTLQL